MDADQLTESGRLPRGRHGLTREEVAAAQRERLLRGLVSAMAVKGYAATSVADVLRAAGVSRETFYELYPSKAAAFMDAFQVAVETTMPVVPPADGPHVTPIARFRAAVHGYLAAIAAEPDLARLFLIEVYAAGPDALRRRVELQQTYVAAVKEHFGLRTAEAAFGGETLVAALSTMVTARLIHDDIPGLMALEDPIVRLAERLLDDA